MKFIRNLFLIIFCISTIAEAQFYSHFGRNKVQYDAFDWKILKTEHFDIYYYNDMLNIAEIGAAIAEKTYDEYKVKFNTLITRRIPLIFYNTSIQFQQTNTTPGFIPDAVGGFFEFAKGRVVIPSTGSLHDFRHVIRHELAHVFMTTKASHVLSDHRSSSGTYPYLWYTEGFAEYMSTSVDAQAEMVIRDALFNDYFVGLEDFSRIYGTFLMYKEGQAFLEYVREAYGPGKVMQMLDNIWMYSKFYKVVAYTLGKPLEQIDREWKYYLKQKYYPLFKDVVPINILAKNITDFGFNFSPVPYKDGENEYLYFVANRNGYSSLYKVQINQKEENKKGPELVIRGEKSEEFEAFHLFQSAIDVTESGKVAFVTKIGARDGIHFYSIKNDVVTNTFTNEHLITIRSPKFSSDGDKVVFQAVGDKGYSDIYLLNLLDNSLTRLTNDYYDDRDPSFGIDDKQIVFSSDRTAGEYEHKYNLFTYNVDTHNINYVTYLDANCSAPSLSKDKTELVFTSEMEGVKNIYLMNIKNGKYKNRVSRLTNFITSAFTPVFLDSSDITFAGFNNYQFDLYRFNYKKQLADSAFIISMNFDSTDGQWTQDKLIAKGARKKLHYERKYSLDYAQSQVSTDPIFGTQGGAVVSLSDLLGNDNYFFTIYNSAQSQSEFFDSFNLILQRVDLSKRTNYGYGVFHYTGNRYDIRDSDEFFFERSFGGFFVLNFPLSKFDRIETSVTVANSDKQVITGVIERKALLVGNAISYVFDNSLWGPTGPLDGTRARLLLGYTGDVKFSNVNYYTVIADLRHYFRLGYRSAFAVRSALFYNDGKEARRYFMGGSWDIRGWPRFSIRGEKMWLSSVELRFPLLDQINLKFPFINLGFFGLRGAAFFDAGGAWDSSYKETVGSMGVGVRFNLFGALVLRYDVGKKIQNNFSEFQNGLFYQFFFGWDF